MVVSRPTNSKQRVPLSSPLMQICAFRWNPPWESRAASSLKRGQCVIYALHLETGQRSLGRSTQKLLIKMINKHKQGMILVSSPRLGNTKTRRFPEDTRETSGGHHFARVLICAASAFQVGWGFNLWRRDTTVCINHDVWAHEEFYIVREELPIRCLWVDVTKTPLASGSTNQEFVFKW